MMFIVVLIIAVAVAAAAGLVIGRNTRNARILGIVAQVITVATVTAMIPLVSNSGVVATLYLLGVPLAAAALPLLGGNVLLWVAAAVIILVWGVLLSVGLGFYLLPAGFCMLAAATAQLRASARDRK